MMIKKSKKVLSMPVVSLEDGGQLGRVRDLIIDPAKKCVVALVLDQRGIFKENKVLPFERIKSFGEHAVTVEKSVSVERLSAFPSLAKLLKETGNLSGTLVMTEEGSILGNVDEYAFDTTSGEISVLEINGKLVDNLLKGRASLVISDVSAFGKNAVIARPGAQSRLEREDASLQEAFKSVREAGTRIWDSTVLTTKKLGESIGKSVEKVMETDDKKRGGAKKDNGQSASQQPPVPAELPPPEGFPADLMDKKPPAPPI